MGKMVLLVGRIILLINDGQPKDRQKDAIAG
jgi:hypothetical protein